MSTKLSIYQPELIQKNINNYSFTKELINNVNNFNFKNSAYETLSGINDTEQSYIWTALSSMVENNSELSNLLHNNFSYEFENDILNYIDNISDIDTCKIKSLQSMIQNIGVNYTIFDKIKLMPIQILKILDILSIKKEYLVNSDKVNEIFSNLLFQEVSSDLCVNPDISKIISSLTDCRFNSIITSTNETYPLSTQLENIPVNSTVYIDDEKLRNYTLSIYGKILSSFCYMKYNTAYAGDYPIFMHLSSNILLSNFVITNTNDIKIEELEIYRLKYNIKNTFNESSELDKIEYGITTYKDYSIHEQYLLSAEAKYRAQPFDSTQLYSRYYYYRERTVRDYFNFVENEYVNYLSLYLSTEQYNINNEYIVVTNNLKNSLFIQTTSSDYLLNNELIDYTANVLTEITEAVRDIREQIKNHVQRNFIKGTKNHLSYVIREYIRNNIYPAYKKLANSLSFDSYITVNSDYNISDVIININEYIDPTEYFNISTNIDTTEDKVNHRYWEGRSSVYSIVPYNSTNIFKKPDVINSATRQFFTQIDIEKMYKQSMQIHFATDISAKTDVSNYYDADQNKHLSIFLDNVYNSGADTTYQDSLGNICCNLDFDNTILTNITKISTDNEWRQYKETLFKQYSGQDIGTQSFYNIKNKKHPSYQIHPYIKNFIKYDNFKYPIENVANIITEKISDIFINHVSNYIDISGYIINAWKNPFNTNSDYITEYENSPNKTPLNTVFKQIDYDGLFYPEAINDFLLNPNKFTSDLCGTEVSCGNKWYNELNLSYDERCRIARQLTGLSSYINDVVNSTYDIYRYGKDFYGNAYILLKNYNVKSFNKMIEMTPDEKHNDIPGFMWMRIKNHPIALPMMVYSEDNKINNALTQIEQTDSEIEKQQNIRSNLKFDDIQKHNIGISYKDTNLFVPIFYDFTISKDRTSLLFYTELKLNNTSTKYIIYVNSNKIYYRNKPNRRYKYYFILTKLKKQWPYNVNNSGYIIDNEFKFIKFYNFDLHVGLVLAKAEYINNNNDFKCYIKLPYFDKYNIYNNIINNQLYFNCVCKDCANDALDDYKIDITNKKRLTIAYRSKEFQTDVTVEDYLGMKLKYPNSSSQTMQRLNIFTNSLKTVEYRFDKKQFRQIEFDRNYIPYNDLGFIPLYEYNNEDQILRQNNPNYITKIFNELYSNNNGYYYECLSAKGQLKFNLVGRSDSKGIFFKNVRPIRTYEQYKMRVLNKVPSIYSNKIYEVNYFDAHYLEISSNMKNISSDINIYTPYEFQQNIKNHKILSVRLDESYFRTFASLSSQYKQLSSKQYLDSFNDTIYYWRTTNNLQDFKELYNPGQPNQTIKASILNTYVIQLPNSRNDNTVDNISVNVILPENNEYGTGIKIDFNSSLYNNNNIDKTPINYFNWKHSFLNLDSPGDAGYLQIWHKVQNKEYSEPGNIYYIKNISDKKPKFILSLSSEITINLTAENLIKNEFYLIDEINNTSRYLEAQINNLDISKRRLTTYYTGTTI